MMTQDCAVELVKNILEEKLGVSSDYLADEYLEKSLFLKPFALSSISMVFLVLELEKSTGYLLNTSLFTNMGFNTIKKIASVVCESEAG